MATSQPVDYGRRPCDSSGVQPYSVGPMFLNIKDGESKDDVIDTLVGITDKAPPNKREGVMA